MNKIRFWTVGLMVLFSLLAGCSTAPQKAEVTMYIPEAPAPLVVDKSEKMAKELLAQYREWRGTPYKMGGSSKKGVDCSAFVQMTFKERFGKHIPRSSREQAQLGKVVAKPQLKTGDLVFFRTSRSGNHVGVYIDHGQFLHASTSKGVIISRLDNVYWRDAWWMAKRIDSLEVNTASRARSGRDS